MQSKKHSMLQGALFNKTNAATVWGSQTTGDPVHSLKVFGNSPLLARQPTNRNS